MIGLPQPPPRLSPVLTSPGSGEATNQFSQPWSGWFRRLWTLFDKGYTGTITLAKLTVGGAEGSITVSQGLITNVVLPS